MKSKYLFCSEVGRLLNPQVTGDRVRQMIDQGLLPATRTSRGWRLVAEDDLRAFIAKRQQRGERPPADEAESPQSPDIR
jgi:hypothetical protein